ncbi:MAG: hypothetical protein RLZZ611_2254 [Cyanobacteriota bacterium]|jgi:fructosamine-3-kinase
MLTGPPAHRAMEQALLGSWLRRELGEELQAMVPVSGGCIHRAWRLELSSGRRLFAKTNQIERLPMLIAEADGLRALAAAAAAARAMGTDATGAGLMVPEPLQLMPVENHGLLLMPWLELSNRPNDPERAWRQLGGQLAALHRASLEGHDGRFGWGQDNVLGSAPQRNRWDNDWGRFFTQQRLAPQLAWASSRGRRPAGAAALLERVAGWLNGHGAEPCLVHGDLWSGNAGLLASGGGALFDPAVYRGDREVDLAMAQLFGGFPTAFFKGYEQEWPLPTGHRQRRELYNLYHLLNHANLFGGSYWDQAERSIRSLLKAASP